MAVEAQLRKDPDKPCAWAYYASYLHEKHGIPVIVLVVCQDDATARWAEGPLHLGLRQWPTLTVRPLVLGPGSVPAITDVAAASRDNPLATLSALTHALDPEADCILKALFSALKTTDEDTARIFAELTELGLGDAPAAKAWSEMMTVDLSFFRSRTSQMLRNEGRAEGRSEGRAEGIAGDVLLILADRGLVVSDWVRMRVEACEDAEELRRWLLRAVRVERAEDIFAAAGE